MITKSQKVAELDALVSEKYKELVVWENAHWENECGEASKEVREFIRVRKSIAYSAYLAAKTDLWLAR